MIIRIISSKTTLELFHQKQRSLNELFASLLIHISILTYAHCLSFFSIV